jgi:hypothetical protein
MDDAIEEVRDILIANWTKGNTDNTVPSIISILDSKMADARFGDFVMTSPVSHTERPASLGYSEIDFTDVVAVDVRTSVSRARLIKLRDEVRRCIYQSKTAIGDFRLASIEGVTDTSDKMRKLYRMVIDVKLRRVLETTPS